MLNKSITLLSRPSGKKISELIQELIHELRFHLHISLGDLVAKFGKRSIALAILLFAILTILPIAVVPGFSVITAAIIVLLAWQELWRNKTLWLPVKMNQKSIKAKPVVHGLKKAVPWILRLEKICRPRLTFLFNRLGQVVISVLIISQCLLLMLPIPFSNFFYGLFIALLALALLEQDGLMAIGSLVLIVVYNTIIFWVFEALVKQMFIKFF